MKKGKFYIHPLFLLLIFIVVIFDNAFIYFCYIFALIIHEYAHYYVAKRLGYHLNNICLMPYGAQLNLAKNIFSAKDEILIAIAGPLVNFLLGILGLALFWIFPSFYNYGYAFVYANFILCIFNLLPFVPLDGSRIFLALFGLKHNRFKALKRLNFLNCFASIFLFICFIYSAFYNINYTLGIVSLFLILGAFEKSMEYEYSSLFSFEKSEYLKKQYLPIKEIAVNKNFKINKIYKFISPSYYTILYVMDDNMTPIKKIYECEFEKYFVDYEKKNGKY